MEQGLDKRKLAQFEKTEITLSEEQHTQMCGALDVVNQVAVDNLHCILKEGKTHGVGSKLKEIWIRGRS